MVPLEFIFCQCLETGKFPTEWKKTIVVPVYKKGDKKILKNYLPVSLLRVCGNFFEKLIYRFFMENSLISSNQPGYKPGGSGINQVLHVAHEIYKSLDCGYDVRGYDVFLEI